MKNLLLTLAMLMIGLHSYSQPKTPKQIFHDRLVTGRKLIKENKLKEARNIFAKARKEAIEDGLGNQYADSAKIKIEQVDKLLLSSVSKPSIVVATKPVKPKPTAKPIKKVNDSIIDKNKISQLKSKITIPVKYPFMDSIDADGLKRDIVLLLKKPINYADTIKLNEENKEVTRVITSLYGIDLIERNKQIYDSISKNINQPNLSEDTFYMYLEAAAYYLWNLDVENRAASPKKVDEMVNTIEKTLKVIAKNPMRTSAKMYHAYSNIENVLNVYYDHRPEFKGDKYIHCMNAANLGLKAVSLNHKNTFFIRSLLVYIKNITLLDNNYISAAQKTEFLKLASEMARYSNTNSDDKLLAMSSDVDGTADEVKWLLENNKSSEAIELVNKKIKAVEALMVVPKKTVCPYAKPIYLSKLYSKLGDIYESDPKDTPNLKQASEAAQKLFIVSLDAEIESLRMTQRLRENFDAISKDVMYYYNNDENYFFENTIRSIEEGKSDYFNNSDLANIHINACTNLAYRLVDRGTANDSLKAISCLDKAISTIGRTRLLKNPDTFSESYADYARAYRFIIALYVNKKNYFRAKQYYTMLQDNFKPIHEKYGFDYYCNYQLMHATNDYGTYLHSIKKYKEAIPPLAFASFEGIRNATVLLAGIYKNENPKLNNPKKVAEYEQRSTYQNEGFTPYEIPCDLFVSGNFKVYLHDKAENHPYKGIEDQIKWLEVARGGQIDKEERDFFIKCQDKAWKNHVSFQELYMIERETKMKDKVLEIFNTAKTSITLENTYVKKQAAYDLLATQYDREISSRQNSDDTEIIIEDAIATYNDYAYYLIKNNNIPKAKTIYAKIIALDENNDQAENQLLLLEYNEKSGDTAALLQENDSDKLTGYLHLSLKKKKEDIAEKIKQKLLNGRYGAGVIDDINEIYYAENREDHFDELFLKDKTAIGKNREFFMEKYYDTDSYTETIRYYSNLIKLDLAYLDTKPDHPEASRVLTAQHYNSLGWYKLLNWNKALSNKDTEGVIEYFNKSIEYDPKSNYPVGNIPHVYLFNDDYETAKNLYLKNKNQPFDANSKYKTFKEAFLSDFNDFEAAGIKNAHFNEIRELLENKS